MPTLPDPTPFQIDPGPSAAASQCEPTFAPLRVLVGVGLLVCDRDGRILCMHPATNAGILAFSRGGILVGDSIVSVFDLGPSGWERLAGSLLIEPGRGDRAAGGNRAADDVRQPSANSVLRLIRLRLDAGRGDADPTSVYDLFASVFNAGNGVADGLILITVIDSTRLARVEGEIVDLRSRLVESERARSRLNDLRAELASDRGPDRSGQEMIGDSLALRRVREQVSRVSPTSTTVLIQGETGSGKELVARLVHAQSPRRAQAFVAVNCAAMPESLLESELFGHERGAFTGADRRKLGKFELADGGTLFLDEVAEMPLAAQAKLLRVLQERTFERVGGVESVKVDVRLVAATHRDLARQVERSRFREDLFYRLMVFRIDVPPLRDRKEDLRALVEHLHERFARRMARPVVPLSERSMRRLVGYHWPGNVRELANTVERATLLSDGVALEIDLPQSPLGLPAGGGSIPLEAGRGGNTAGRAQAGGPAQLGGGGSTSSASSDILLDLSLEQLQRLQIVHALEMCSQRVFGDDGAAARLEINPRTLLSRMDKFGIPRPRMARASERRG